MPSVGLITFHHVPNFGAFLQAWSLVQIMQRLGCSVQVIDYRPPGHKVKNRRRGLKAFVPSLGRLRMRRFMEANLPLTPILRSTQEVADYVNTRRFDCVVCGSDQIWMMDSFLGLDRTYYLDVGDATKTRRVSYAASCGSMHSYGEHGEEVKQLLSRFHGISVRDENTLRILCSLGITQVTHVVDPTLLADFQTFVTRPRVAGDYIAVAGDMDAMACRLVRNIADRLKVEVVAIGTRCSTADREKRFVNPGEWASYLANARFVVTSLFHGTALAIRFHKPFIALGTAGRAFKVVDLLKRFGLERRWLENNPEGGYLLRPDLLELDYSAVEKRLCHSVNTSLEYLRGALRG